MNLNMVIKRKKDTFWGMGFSVNSVSVLLLNSLKFLITSTVPKK